MPEIVGTFVRAKTRDEGANSSMQSWDGPSGDLAQERLEFAEGHLDRVKVGGILRQIAKGRARGFDRLADAGDFVGSKIIDHHDRLLVEVSQFRVTGPTPRDHANSGSRKALCGSAGRQLGLACNGRVGKKARPAAGPERLYDVDCFLSHGANLHRGQSTRDPTPSADDRTALEPRFFRRVADFTLMRARPPRRNSSPARRIGVSDR
jgi:hypothetical protein